MMHRNSSSVREWHQTNSWVTKYQLAHGVLSRHVDTVHIRIIQWQPRYNYSLHTHTKTVEVSCDEEYEHAAILSHSHGMTTRGALNHIVPIFILI